MKGVATRIIAMAAMLGAAVAQASDTPFVPVTDAMIQHPDPKDWLIYRGNYQAWSHSGLSQVNDSNVEQLQLKWSWAMNEGGQNATGPTIHDGIMFLANTSNTVQALNAKTGELLWENRLGPVATRAYSALRSLAVFEDKVYINATDARLYALDAKTGKVVWNYDGESQIWGSPMCIDGKIYLGNQDGRLRIFEAGPKLNLIADHDMGNSIYSTPVFANGTLYVMTMDKLYAIGEKK